MMAGAFRTLRTVLLALVLLAGAGVVGGCDLAISVEGLGDLGDAIVDIFDGCDGCDYEVIEVEYDD